MADIFREVDEDLRHEQMHSLWRKYGKYLIACVVFIVLAVAGTNGWDAYKKSKAEKDSKQFAAAIDLLKDDKAEQAAAAFAELSANAGTAGYAYVAGLQAAGAEIRLGRKDKAVEIYWSLAGKDIPDPFLADYAALMAVMHSLDSGLTPEMADRLNAMAADGANWSMAARQLQALLAYSEGRTADAKNMLMALAENVEAPQSVRDRARQLAAVMDDQK